MALESTSSDLHRIWNVFKDFEAYTRNTDGDLNLFIEEWKEKMIKVQSAGCQYSDLLLGLKLIDRVNLNHDAIVSIISNLSSYNFNSEGFLTKVVTNIKKQGDTSRSRGTKRVQADRISRDDYDLDVSEELEIKSSLLICSKCPDKFFDEDTLSKHQLQFHQDASEDINDDSTKGTRYKSGFLKCPICGKNFLLMENLVNHTKNHDKEVVGSDKDSSLSQVWTDSSEIDADRQFDDDPVNVKVKAEVKSETCKESLNKKGCGKLYKCSLCPKEWERPWKLMRHMEVHMETRDHKCSKCGNAFKGRDGLRKHLANMHAKEKPVPKEQNPDPSVKMLKKEKAKPNSNPAEKKPKRSFPCEVCGKTISEDWMKKHVKKCHLTKIYKCDNCPREFTKLPLLEKHLETHSDNHECSICHKIFKGPTHLKLHMDTHKTTRDFICTYCGKKYKTYHVLRDHLNLHTKANPMPCNFCDKVFFNYASRKFHVRRHHTGEKPYKCDFCEKRFFTSTHKVDHMRTHTGEKPFPCRVCGRYFRETNTLKRHVKNVHKDVKPINA